MYNVFHISDEVVEQKVWKFFESKNKSYVLCSLCQDLLYIGGMSKTPTYQCYSTLKGKIKQMYIMKRHLNHRHGLSIQTIKNSTMKGIMLKFTKSNLTDSQIFKYIISNTCQRKIFFHILPEIYYSSLSTFSLFLALSAFQRTQTKGQGV